MQILSLELENTKSYESGQIQFATGVNAIVGHNGAGKSTILEAIGFVLFDALEYRQEEFVREGAATAEIVVTFASSVDGRRYQVVRRCGSSTQYRVFDPELGTKLCEGKADVLRFLRQHMGVELALDLPSLFRDAVGVPQGTLTAVFLEPVSKRKSTFDRLLQVEEYNRAANKLVEPARLLRERRQSLELQLSALSARLERLPQLEQMVAQRTAQLQATIKTMTEVELRLATLTAQRTVLTNLQQQLFSLRTRHAHNSQLLARAAAQLRSAEQALAQAEQAQQIVAQAQSGYTGYLAAQTQQKRLDELVRKRQRVERVRADLDKELAQAQTELTGLLRDLAAVEEGRQTVAALHAAVQRQGEIEAALVVAQQQSARLTDAQRLVTQQERQHRRTLERVSELTAQLDQAASLEARHQVHEGNVAAARTLIDAGREATAAAKSAGDLLNRQKNTLLEITTARCPVCEQPLIEEHRREMLAKIDVRLKELRSEYKRYQDELKRQETTLQQEERAAKQLQEELRQLPRTDEVARAQQELAAAEEAWQRAQAQVGALASAPQQVIELTETLAALENPRQRFAIAEALVKRGPALERRQNEIAVLVQTKEGELAALSAQLEQFITLDADLAAVVADLRSHEPAYQTFLTHAQLAESAPVRRNDVDQAHQLYALTKSELAQLEQELATVTATFDETTYQRLTVEEQEERRRFGGLQAEIKLLQQQQAHDEQEIATLQAQRVEAEQLISRRTQIETQETTLEAMRGVLKQAGPQVTQALIQQVSSSADQIFCDMMQDYTRRLRWNDDYGVTLEAAGHERQFAQLSGGEQMTAALAVRLALLREMSTINVAFFDEPTTNLDESRRDALVRQVLDIKGFGQLFVISHDDTFEQATQNLIRVERVDGKSVIAHL